MKAGKETAPGQGAVTTRRERGLMSHLNGSTNPYNRHLIALANQARQRQSAALRRSDIPSYHSALAIEVSALRAVLAKLHIEVQP